MTTGVLPEFPYGAVYFRKSNPPREDWVRDYRTAAEDGINIFRHWFLWSAIEVAPNEFDWEDYDNQLQLAAENGIKTIIAEMVTAAPEWAFRRLAHARFERRDGRSVHSSISVSCVTGGFPGLCLDNEEAKQAAGRFLTTLASRYKDHPGLGGYDVWNECGYLEEVCYCPATAAKFRTWLRDKYGDLKTLGQAWGRHSYAEWDDIEPPRDLAPYADVLDWLTFRRDNAYDLMSWRVDLIRAIDPDHPITAHGVAGTLVSAASCGTDDWKAAEQVDSYGLTWIAARQGDEPWKQLHAVDLVRGASRGKRFWHAEAQGGPLWMQPQVLGRPRDDGRIATPEDVRLWNMMTFCGGGTGLLYPRWRPLLDGPLFGAFGAYGMDGDRTDRSAMVSAVATWATAEERRDLWRSGPIRGDVGIVYVPETQLFDYAQQGSVDHSRRAARGAYEGFFANNIQADFVHLDDIAHYQLLYLPFPIMLSEPSADRLAAWVHAGGTLISEGCPAYFGERGRVATTQPGYKLNALFGAEEDDVEFTPDILDDLSFRMDGYRIRGGIFAQAYRPISGSPVGWYDNGLVAGVDHQVGDGRTKLVGTFPGAGYGLHHDTGTRDYFANLLTWAGRQPHLRVTNPTLIARLHDGAGGRYLWVLNPARTRQHAAITLGPDHAAITDISMLWGSDEARLRDQRVVEASIQPRDALVLRIQSAGA